MSRVNRRSIEDVLRENIRETMEIEYIKETGQWVGYCNTDLEEQSVVYEYHKRILDEDIRQVLEDRMYNRIRHLYDETQKSKKKLR